MDSKKIVIFGAQGHLGHSLVARLNAIKPASVSIVGTTDKGHNKELAAEADLAVITVRPQHVASLLSEISPSLKPTAQILSFAAGVPIADIAASTKHPVARGMADPWWNFAGFVFGRDFKRDAFDFLFHQAGKKTVPLQTEADIDAFTAYFVHAYIVLFMRRLGELENSNAHLAYLAPHLLSSVTELLSLTPEGDAAEELKKLATPGGVTESILLAIRADKLITPDAAHAIGMERIKALRK